MATLSEAYRDHPLHLRHIIPLDFSSLSTLPDSHVWHQPDEENLNFSSFNQYHDDNGTNDNDDHESSLSVPIIDLANPNAIEQLSKACENWGAFQLKNHGVSYSVFEDVEKEGKKLFALPTEQKLKALRSPGGATGYGIARISQFFPKYMWHEGFTIIGSPSSDAKKIWPNDYSKFCDKIENYQKQMRALSEQLTHMMFHLLQIPEEEKKWLISSTNNNNNNINKNNSINNNHKINNNNNNNNNNNYGAVQLNFYPCCPEPKRAMGLAPHTDTSLFTILHQSQTNGLQIFKEGKGWVPINPKNKNTLIVHTGDFLHILSNARFKCALHRVVVNTTRHRYSVAYFHNPPLDYVVSPLVNNNPKNDDDDGVNYFEAKFRKVSVKEYIGIKAKNFGEALSMISTT